MSTNEQNTDHGNQGANDMNYGSRPAAATIAKVKWRQQVSLCNVLVHQPDNEESFDYEGYTKVSYQSQSA